jgi:hypothetical protein
VKSELYRDLVISARFRPQEQAMRRMVSFRFWVIEWDSPPAGVVR